MIFFRSDGYTAVMEILEIKYGTKKIKREQQRL